MKMTNGDIPLYNQIQAIIHKAGLFTSDIFGSDNELNVFVNGKFYVYYAKSTLFTMNEIDTIFNDITTAVLTHDPKARHEMFFDWDCTTGRPNHKITK